jgi:hypothetical protein
VLFLCKNNDLDPKLKAIVDDKFKPKSGSTQILVLLFTTQPKNLFLGIKTHFF